MDIILVNGLRRNTIVNKFKVHINSENHSIKTSLFASSSHKDKRTTLFVINFLRKAGIVLYVVNENCNFIRNPKTNLVFQKIILIFKLEPQRIMLQ